MPAKEIKELRQAGKLDEALEMAMSEYKDDSNNIWTKRNLSWVYYDFLKRSNTVDDFDKFQAYLVQIVSLELSEDEKMLFDNVARAVVKMGYAFLRENDINLENINILFDSIKEFHFTKPNEIYSSLFQMFHRAYKGSVKYIEFADWWDFENFRQEDYKEATMPNGKTVMALAEQAYIAYAKQLLPQQITFYSGNQKMEGNLAINKEKVNEFLPKLDKLEELYPNYQYPSYFKAKLLLALGDKDNVLSVLLPFARRKRNDFWVWDIISEIFPEKDEKKFACYCKGLLCSAPENMSVNLRTKIIPFFIERQLWSEARTEIDKVINIRENNNWKIPQNLLSYRETEWYTQAVKKNNNKLIYKEYAPIAEEILFSDITEEIIIVDFVNKEKKVLNFIALDEKIGFYKYDRFLKEVNVGDELKVRFIKKEANGQCQVATIQKSENNELQKIFIKDFRGVIRIKDGSNFGFVEDIFVSPMLCKGNNLLNGDLILGKAIKSFNSKKNEWGWKAYETTEKLFFERAL